MPKVCFLCSSLELKKKKKTTHKTVQSEQEQDSVGKLLAPPEIRNFVLRVCQFIIGVRLLMNKAWRKKS